MSLAAKAGILEALALVDDPSTAIKQLHTTKERKRNRTGKLSRLLKRLDIYSMIAKIHRARRWRLTRKGWALLSACISLKEDVFPPSAYTPTGCCVTASKKQKN